MVSLINRESSIRRKSSILSGRKSVRVSGSSRSSISSNSSTTNTTSTTTTTSNSTSSLNLNESKQLISSYKKQTFWKYHILKISPNEFYLTTNPDNKHKFIRNAPSYFVHLELPSTESKPDNKKKLLNGLGINESQVAKGFKLTFIQQQVSNLTNNGDSNSNFKPFTIEKTSAENGGFFQIHCHYNEFQNDLNIVNNGTSTPSINLKFNKINEDYNYDKNIAIKNYYDFNKFLLIAQLGEKKKKLFKTKIDGTKLSKTGSIYFLDLKFFKKLNWFDPIIALFRPCNRQMKDKLTKKMMITNSPKNYLKSNKLSIDFSNINLKNSLENSNENVSDESDSEFDFDDIEDEIDYTGINDDNNTKSEKFYVSKDGLFQRHPQDDSPNDFKLGWITIFEKGRYFEKIPGGGNWEVVLGLTFAAGFETLIDKYLKEYE